MDNHYVTGHLAMIDIGRRFETLVASLPHKNKPMVSMYIRLARNEGKWQQDSFANYYYSYLYRTSE